MTTARHFGSDNYKALQEARRYPAIKSWFLKKYPEIEEFGQEKNSDDAATDTDSEYTVVMEPLEKAG